MIYTVEEALQKGESEEVWNRWSSEMKPIPLLLAVPGFLTAQRFKGLGVDPAPSLAIYSLESGDVLTSEPYLRGARGGNLGTPSWKAKLSFWHRNLFSGLDRAPPVALDARLLVQESATPDVVVDSVKFIWLTAAGLDRTTPCRGLAVVEKAAAQRYLDAPRAGLTVYAPLAAQAVSAPR